MNFKKIEMQGFKSFAEPVTIEFNEGITGIVGPNGSGKSNISDAIRWVLGEQSPKMLRGGKMEEVIFAGTSSRKSRGMAEVTLVIGNEDGSLPIDYREVAITRRMFRSGESEYHINGNQCRLKDVRDLIMDTGIGVDGYSLIGQGKIADIISNKTEDRREIFEEAAGIVAYRTRKAQAERKLASTTVNMDRVKDIIGEIEGRIDGLREDSIKAREYLKLRQRYKELEINIILKNIENLELKNEYAKDDLAELEYALGSIREERSETEQQTAELNEKRQNLEKIEEETRQKLMTAIEELNRIVNKSEVDGERLTSIGQNQDRISEELLQLEERREREERNRQTVLDSKAEVDAEAEAARKDLEAKVADYSEMASEMAALSAAEDEAKNELFRLSGEITRADSEISSMEMLQETLRRRRETLQQEQESGSVDSRRQREELEQATREKETAEEELQTLRQRQQELTEKLKTGDADRRQLTKELEEIRLTLGQMSARRRTIEEMENNYEGYNGAVRYVMKSGLRGIRGVVADLITVPKGYETAIETALGASLQNIVCDDDASAREAIRALKRDRAGRMTFLPLASIRANNRREDALASEAGFIGFGPECVECDPQYDEIIEYLLGRVVVADHIDSAIRISKKARSVRVVTLDGEIINPAGAITGGRYRNKTADILERKSEIRSLQERIGQMTEDRDQKTGKLQKLTAEMEAFGRESSELEGMIRTGERALLIKDNEIHMAETALSDFRSGEEKILKEMESIRDEIGHSEEVIGQLRESIRDCKEKQAEVTAQSEQHRQAREAKQADFDRVSEEITKARIAVTSCEERASHADYILKTAAETLEQIDQDIWQRQQQRENFLREKEELTSGHASMEELIREKENAKGLIEEYLAEVSEEKQQVSGKLNEASAERDRLAARMEELQDRKYEMDIRKAKNETQLETYKDKLWEDFEVSYIQAMEFKAEKFVMSSAVKENRQIKARMKEMGEVNVGAIEEYETVKERYEFLTAQQADIQSAMDSLNGIIREMDKTIRERFRDSFDQIVITFEEMFTELFGGGHAELRLSDENDPLTSDIDIVAQPPGKKLQNINLLSGGEKTLTAIALMFAVLKVKPTPFCILDEVEAALDDANIDRFIQALRRFEGIQFALVTHQKATMEQADVLYGVTMPEKGVSKVLSLDLGDTTFAEENN